jgi:hypothetical protein
MTKFQLGVRLRSVDRARSLASPLAEFAHEKFVLLSGPRQVGKTTLARAWAGEQGRYLTWDAPPDRRRILKDEPFTMTGRLVLDELHKYPRWKSYLKGLYDTSHEKMEVVVTGSARLDVYARGGDSMLGRYEQLRLHPLTLGELTHGTIPEPPVSWVDLLPPRGTHSALLDQLETFGGFPEPFENGTRRFHVRWSARRQDLLLRQDLRELTQIRAHALVEHLWLLLPDRVGSPLSVNALREELGVAHDTVSSWLDVLERLYLTFRLKPHVVRRSRSLTKERKLYLLDWSQLEDPGARFENLVASHLLKSVQLWSDLGYGDYDLAYHRDREKREVDFVVLDRRRPIALIECKLTDEAPSPSLLRLGEILGPVPRIQLLRRPGIDRVKGNLRVVSAGTFLPGLC